MDWTWFIVIMIVIATVLGYGLASFFFLKNPSLLHKKKKAAFVATHISHRGGAGENGENTMTAFQHAVNLGSHMLEIDCHITRDQHIVVSHDNNLRRTTGVDVTVSETLFKDLPLLKDTLRPDFQQNHEVVLKEDRNIPLLREVFEKFPDTPINIDIKIDDDTLIEKVSLLAKEFNRERITVWGNRSNVVAKKCFKQNPDIGLFFSMNRVVVIMLLYYAGLLPFIPLKETHYEIIMPSSLLREGVFGSQMSKRNRFLIRVVDWLLMSKSAIKHLTNRGIQVYLWVLNDNGDFERAFQLGATGVMTDFPTKLADFLAKTSVITTAH